MFERDRQDDYSTNLNTSSTSETILSEDTRFKGSLEFSNKLTVNGHFEGNLNSKGTLYIGSNGEVRAEIKVGTIVIEGKVWGNITADDKIEIRSSAELYGDIKANRLIISEGATFVGKSDVNPNRKEKVDVTMAKPQQEKPREMSSDDKKDKKESKEVLFGGIK
ncbi:MAG: polymer-forming cytoskeletal protein [Candidatus Auribacterota bacterium]|jgi:cytoskeletal protein CcmA (bactofilin family)|nr:polymer-forming cytoskeletal protein [Candidatus Auribacterota bacterium]